MSSQPISLAKTTRPALGSVARREALFMRLDGQPLRTVAWISGPPGAGKSTLAASYVDARGCQCAWYQIDPDDADVATFFHYLGHAARKLGAGTAPDLPAFTPAHLKDVGAFARRFFRQMFAHAQVPAALVLDNLHEAAAPLHEVLEAGLAQVPKGCCVIITSRGEPPPSLARMRVSGEMVCVGGDELRIESREIAEIATLRGLSLTPDALAKLQERTQGWAAGLVLMLEHAKISGRITEFPSDTTPKVMFDYFAGEIFERFEPATQHFLLRIACLPRMTVRVAETLAGEKMAGRLLLNLAQNEYFVRETVTDDARVYQLHPLLREFLRSRAARELPEAVSPAQLRRASALLCGDGHVEEAVSLLIECGDWSEVARVVVANADTLLIQGRSELLGNWLALLPRRQLESNPRLLLVYAASRMHASPRMARQLFEQAYEGLRQGGDAREIVQCCRGVINAVILEFDDLAALDRWIVALADALATAAAASAAAIDPAAAETLIRALLLRDAGNPELGKWLEYADRAARDAVLPAATGVAEELALARAMAAALRGDCAHADRIIAALGDAASAQSPAIKVACGIAGTLNQLVDGSCVAALESARASMAIGAAEGLHEYDEWLHALAAAAALLAGKTDIAAQELKLLEAAGAQLRRGDRAFLHFLRGWLAALKDDAAGTHREAKIAVDAAVEVGMPWLECLARLSHAQTLLQAGDQRGADTQLRNAQALAQQLRSPMLEASVQAVTAATALHFNDEDSARAALAAAFVPARERGLRHLIGVRAGTLADLCALALRSGIESDYARALISTGNLTPPRTALHLKQWPRPYHVRTLGGFDLLRASDPIEFSKKGPGRPVELLKVLVALGGRNVRASQLADELWPRVDADYAHKSFTATLHRLRRILEADDALTLSDGRLSLNPALFWVDTWAFDHVLAELDNALREHDPRSGATAVRALVDAALAVYTGPFLPDESEQPSYIACREQLRAKLLRSLGRASRQWEQGGMSEIVLDCYQRCIDADELCEAFHRGLMQCYQRLGDHVEAMAAYERLRTLLAARLKATPSPETQAVYEGLLAQPAAKPAPRK